MKKNTIQKTGRDDFIEVVKHTPLVSIDLIVTNDDDQILLGLRTNEPAKGCWFVPGGRILKNERITEALKRIACEELGATPDDGSAHFLGVFEHFYDKNFAEVPGLGTHYIVLAYEIRMNQESLNLPEDQHSQYKWLSKKTLLQTDNIHPNTRAYFQSNP